MPLNLTTLQGRIWRRLGENPVSPQWWTPQESVNALNWSQRLFVLLTLCLEDQREWQLTAGVNYYHMLADPLFPDWLLPLRFRLSNDPSTGANSEPNAQMDGTFQPNAAVIAPPAYNNAPKIKPARLADFDAYSDTWPTTLATPTRYALLGSDLVAFNSAPATPGVSVLVTFARVPVLMVKPTDVPEIPDVDQPVLADMATVFMRLKDGGQELNKCTALLTRFGEAAQRRAAQVRARSLSEQYDRVPFEIQRFDWSRLVGRRKDLPPTKQREE
jgi:hypothetical protein